MTFLRRSLVALPPFLVLSAGIPSAAPAAPSLFFLINEDADEIQAHSEADGSEYTSDNWPYQVPLVDQGGFDDVEFFLEAVYALPGGGCLVLTSDYDGPAFWERLLLLDATGAEIADQELDDSFVGMTAGTFWRLFDPYVNAPTVLANGNIVVPIVDDDDTTSTHYLLLDGTDLSQITTGSWPLNPQSEDASVDYDGTIMSADDDSTLYIKYFDTSADWHVAKIDTSGTFTLYSGETLTSGTGSTADYWDWVADTLWGFDDNVGSGNAGIVPVDDSDGSEGAAVAWTDDDLDVHTPPGGRVHVVSNGLAVYRWRSASDQYGIRARDITDGSEAWSLDPTDFFASGDADVGTIEVAQDGDLLVTARGTAGSSLWKLAIADGATVWGPVDLGEDILDERVATLGPSTVFD